LKRKHQGLKYLTSMEDRDKMNFLETDI